VPRRAKIHGYLVHIYTASTLIFVALGIEWVLVGQFRLALVAMVITLLIDATDGMLARRARVSETAAGIDGALLDNIVDFLSYVVLPMLFMVRADMLPAPSTLWVALVMFASVFGFSRTTAKLADKGFFVGFPSYWNIVVFYLWLFATPPQFNTILLVVLSGLVFVPIRCLYVSRLKTGRSLHFVLGGVWGLFCLTALVVTGPLRTGLLLTSLIYPLVYTIHSFWLDLDDRFPELAARLKT
jgi:phosphatidylcholine synthase